MKKEEKKSVPIEFSVWCEMSHEKTDTGLDLYELVRLGWESYKARKAAAGNGSSVVPNPEQTLTCPHCESTLSVDSDSIAKVVVPGKPVETEQLKLLRRPDVQSSRESSSVAVPESKPIPRDGVEEIRRIAEDLERLVGRAETAIARFEKSQASDRMPKTKAPQKDKRRSGD